jgi:hypothetical protein
MTILNIEEAAQFLGKTPAALRNGYKRWGIPHFRLGGQIKFTREALQEWVENRMQFQSGSAGSNTPPATGRAKTRRSVSA